MPTRTIICLVLLALAALAAPTAAQEPFGDALQPSRGDAVSRRFLPPRFDDSAQLTPLILSIPRAPQPVRATDGRFHLVYELQMLNFGAFPATPSPTPAALEVVEVALFVASSSAPLLVLDGDALLQRMQLLRLAPSPATTELEVGQSGVLYLDVTFPDRQSVPRRISNRVTVRAIPGTGEQPVVDTTSLEVAIDPKPVVVVGPFLRGGPWINANGCCDFASPHRRVGRAVNGKEFWPERFAVDLLKAELVGGELKVCTGDCGQLGDWFSTGEDILAVADGIVTRVVTGQANNPIGLTPFPPVVSTGAGNAVLLAIGDGIFTMYGHMLPGTVSVRVGDRVRRGDVLGKLGNTGQSTAPHLHFQVMDDNSIGGAEGLPWVLDSFVLVGTFDALAEDGTVAGITPIESARRLELPLQQTLIRLP